MIAYNTTLREKSPYLELLWSAFFHIRTEYWEIQSISSYSIRMRENADQNKSEYGHFLRSASIVPLSLTLYWLEWKLQNKTKELDTIFL